MKNFLVLIFLLISVKAYGQASPAVIFNAGYGKVIPEFGLRFKDNKTLISGAANPSVTATDAPIGSIYISSNGLTYQKQDNGSTTNWTPLYFVPVFTDDNRLVRTDGTDNVQQSGVTLSDLDAMTGLTSLDVDLINIDSYIISTTAVDQALELRPNGVGTVDIPYLTNGAALFAGSNGAISQDFANYQYSTLDGLKVDNIRLNDNTISSTDTNGNIIIDPDGTGLVNIPYIGNNHVVYTGPSGNLRGENALSYSQSTNVLTVDGINIGGSSTITTNAVNGSLTLDANGTGIIDVNAPINLESVTANQVAFSDGISGDIVGNANFTYDSLVNSLTAGALNFIDGIISPTAINGNVTISPDGTGEVDVTAPMNIDNGVSVSGSTISGTNAAADLVIAPAALRQIELTGDTEINNLFFPAAVGDGAYITTNLNQDITLAADGTGELSVLTPAEVEQVRIQDNAVTTNVTNGNVTLLANGTGDATVTYGTNELSLDPSRSDDNLLRNGDFENGIVEYACADATGAIVDTTAPTQNNAKMFQMTVSVIGGYCDFTVTTGAALEGILFRIAGQFQTSLAGVEYCTLVNGSVDNCIPVSAKATWTDPLATQSQAGATSAGIRIRSTLATGVINADKFNLKIGGLPTGPTVSCNGDLDCENEFSAYFTDGVGVAVASNLNKAGWVEDATQPATGLYDIPINGFTVTPNCDAEADRGSTGISTVTCEYRQVQSTSSNARVECTNTSGTAVEIDRNFTFSCQKAAPDFKPVTQQGVVNLGQVDAFETQTKTLSTSLSSTQDVADLTFTGLTIGAKYLVTGVANIQSSGFSINELAFFSGAGGTGTNHGKLVLRNEETTGISAFSPSFTFTADSTTLVPRFVRASAGLLVGDGSRNATYIQITRFPDYMSIAASMIDRKIYDGSEQLAGEIAVVGGVEKTVYRRCYEIATDITTTTTIATIDTGLEPTEWNMGSAANAERWYGENLTFTTADYVTLYYTETTGEIVAEIVGSARVLLADRRFCLKYIKP